MSRVSFAVAACLLLGACSATPDAGAGGPAATSTPAAGSGPATAAAGAATPVLPADAALSCDQITSQVDVQNVLVNSSGAAAAAAHKGTSTSQTAGVSQMSELDTIRAAAADRRGEAATVRARQLVAMGKQKNCYKN